MPPAFAVPSARTLPTAWLPLYACTRHAPRWTRRSVTLVRNKRARDWDMRDAYFVGASRCDNRVYALRAPARRQQRTLLFAAYKTLFGEGEAKNGRRATSIHKQLAAASSAFAASHSRSWFAL